jgi:glucose/arabinose dehydrogenase
MAGLLCFLTVLPTVSSAKINDLYKQHCAVCHGDRGEGGLGGSLIDGKYQYGPGDEEWANVIRDGLPELGMQGFADQLNEEQIRAMVVYLLELQARANRAPATQTNRGVIQTDRLSYRIETVLKNPNRMWGVSFLPTGQYLVTEIDGAVRGMNADGTLRDPIQGTPEVVRKGQGGMLDVAVHPEYAQNGWVYLAFSDGEGGESMTSVVRGRIQNNQWVDEEVV